MRVRDEPIHRYFALQGYVSVRVDVRGTGDSYGLMHDEYCQQELEDALEVIAWIAAQNWCDGSVGMLGISWGGFNSLQVAALKPPALKAIISLCAADDRYSDDAHYMGGCLLGENMQWGSILTMYGSYPPDPQVMGEQWLAEWQNRLEALRAYPVVWMQHPWRDSYWRHGSICEDYGAIKIPVYLVGGWADGYSNSILRSFAKLSCPKKALIGPWAHCFPHDARPGPEIGFFFKRRRAGGITGSKAPTKGSWPSRQCGCGCRTVSSQNRSMRTGRAGGSRKPRGQLRACKPQRWYLNAATLDDTAGGEETLSFSSPQTVGVRSGEWCGFGADGEMPRDQRADDGGSLIFDSSPLDRAFEILGTPELTLRLRADKASGLIGVRLCDISPSGSSLRVSYTVLNLCHRSSHSSPEALRPGEVYDIQVKLNDIAHQFPKGHRVRIAVSTSYWPIAWPSPEKLTLELVTGRSFLTLPKRAPQEHDTSLPAFAKPVSAPSSKQTKLLHLPMQRKLAVDLATNELVYTLRSDGGELGGAARARIEDIDLDLSYRLMKRYRILEDDPLVGTYGYAAVCRV